MHTYYTDPDHRNIDPFVQLLRAMRNDSFINKRVITILKMDSYHRRFVLNNWLEQLRLNKAPQKLTQTLSYLFDDNIAAKVYELINRPENKHKIPD